MIVKLHPNLAQDDPVLFFRLKWHEKRRSNFLLVDEFPPIYPILEKADAYLGDYSSIGYDFLAFQRPMFFLQSHQRRVRLHDCGQILDPALPLFASIEQGMETAARYQQVQERLYTKAFGRIDGI